VKRRRKRERIVGPAHPTEGYDAFLSGIVDLLQTARRQAVRSVNSVLTATYWSIGRRIVEHEQRGEARAEYGEELIARLSHDLSARFGRGLGIVNLSQMKRFYLAWPQDRILQTLSEKSAGRIPRMLSEKSLPGVLAPVAAAPPLSWSHYVRLLAVERPEARRFYEEEALRGGWTVRQLGRQIDSQFCERTALSRNKAAMDVNGV